MSDIINTKKIVVTRACVVGKKCDVCGKEIPPTVIPHRCGEPVYDYYEVTRNDCEDSYEHRDVCSPDCAYKLWKEYISDSAGTRKSLRIEVEHINCWTLEYTEVTGDA